MSRAWRYLLAVGIGAAAWCAMAAVLVSESMTAAEEDAVGAILAVDALVGLVALTLLPLRRRYPLVIACVTSAACAVSAVGLGPMVVAVASMATRRRAVWVGSAAAVFVAGMVASDLLWRKPEGGAAEVVTGVVLAGVIFGAAVVTGYYTAARRELVDSLRDRARTAEREQALTAVVARDAERTRIARDMHDVLAHRISLVALHAGALTYRDDLSRGETVKVAQTIQSNAQLALSELRAVLGVLRPDDPSDQPTLAELPALVADAREAGAEVLVDNRCPAGESLPEHLSCTAFRVVQEALTNARKHAPGAPVTIRISGAPAGVLEVEVHNPVGPEGSAPPGVGLVGLAERAELVGGTLHHGRSDGSFIVTARLPWPR
ncbi:signal transduction histidine kinase [Actinokineospora baliensis]|uniref:sensor histidine kinase n=1 Tax=Actinokineospora baliensis TaxID=547056 RepID=UPI001EF8B429|nr:histidine kinase [Actinokineospora baliensis]MBM7773895.1 signal transduction histidine kinase [Actinokineospora baliensis]